jgi:hypothetical protein
VGLVDLSHPALSDDGIDDIRSEFGTGFQLHEAPLFGDCVAILPQSAVCGQIGGEDPISFVFILTVRFGVR